MSFQHLPSGCCVIEFTNQIDRSSTVPRCQTIWNGVGKRRDRSESQPRRMTKRTEPEATDRTRKREGLQQECGWHHSSFDNAHGVEKRRGCMVCVKRRGRTARHKKEASTREPQKRAAVLQRCCCLRTSNHLSCFFWCLKCHPRLSTPKHNKYTPLLTRHPVTASQSCQKLKN